MKKETIQKILDDYDRDRQNSPYYVLPAWQLLKFWERTEYFMKEDIYEQVKKSCPKDREEFLAKYVKAHKECYGEMFGIRDH